MLDVIPHWHEAIHAETWLWLNANVRVVQTRPSYHDDAYAEYYAPFADVDHDGQFAWLAEIYEGIEGRALGGESLSYELPGEFSKTGNPAHFVPNIEVSDVVREVEDEG